jgi:hypothetical protein
MIRFGIWETRSLANEPVDVRKTKLRVDKENILVSFTKYVCPLDLIVTSNDNLKILILFRRQNVRHKFFLNYETCCRLKINMNNVIF